MRSSATLIGITPVAGVGKPVCAQLARRWQSPLLSTCSPRRKAFSDSQNVLQHRFSRRHSSVLAAISQQRATQRPHRLHSAAEQLHAPAALQPLAAAATSAASADQASMGIQTLPHCACVRCCCPQTMRTTMLLLAAGGRCVTMATWPGNDARERGHGGGHRL